MGKRPKEWHAGGKVSTKVSNELLNILKVEVGGNIRPGQYRDRVDPYPSRVPMPRGVEPAIAPISYAKYQPVPRTGILEGLSNGNSPCLDAKATSTILSGVEGVMRYWQLPPGKTDGFSPARCGESFQR